MNETGRQQIIERLCNELDSLAPEMSWCCETMDATNCVRVSGVRRADHHALRHALLVKIDIVLLAGARAVARFVCSQLVIRALERFSGNHNEGSKNEE